MALGKSIKASRFSWELHNGNIPNKLEVCHHCDNPKCVKPEHLFLGTHFENMKDMQDKGRKVVFSGEKNGRCKLTEKQVLEIRNIGKKLSYNQLARKYNVNAKTISDIINRKLWKNI